MVFATGHPPSYRVWTRDCIFVSHADNAVFEADDVLAERFPLASISRSVSFFDGTDHFLMTIDHAWDIAKRIRCGVSV